MMFAPCSRSTDASSRRVSNPRTLEFGIDGGKAYGFNMEVTLRIQVEAIMAN